MDPVSITAVALLRVRTIREWLRREFEPANVRGECCPPCGRSLGE